MNSRQAPHLIILCTIIWSSSDKTESKLKSDVKRWNKSRSMLFIYTKIMSALIQYLFLHPQITFVLFIF